MGEVVAKFRRRDEGSFLVDVIAEDCSKGEIENVRSSVIVSKWPSSFLRNRQHQRVLNAEYHATHLVVSRDNLIVQSEFSLLQSSDMQNVSVVNLHIVDEEVGLAIDDDSTSVVFLSSRFSVEVGLVQNDSESSIGRKFVRVVVELRREVDCLDRCVDVSESYRIDSSVVAQREGKSGLTKFEVILSFRYIVVLLEGSDIMHIKFDLQSLRLLSTTFRNLLARRLRFLKLGLINAQSNLLRHEQCEIDRESESVV